MQHYVSDVRLDGSRAYRELSAREIYDVLLAGAQDTTGYINRFDEGERILEEIARVSQQSHPFQTRRVGMMHAEFLVQLERLQVEDVSELGWKPKAFIKGIIKILQPDNFRRVVFAEFDKGADYPLSDVRQFFRRLHQEAQVVDRARQYYPTAPATKRATPSSSAPRPPERRGAHPSPREDRGGRGSAGRGGGGRGRGDGGSSGVSGGGSSGVSGGGGGGRGRAALPPRSATAPTGAQPASQSTARLESRAITCFNRGGNHFAR
ncbi:MAG: hypothetical protein AAFP26_14765, partial [Planctomycetota bacterium]